MTNDKAATSRKQEPTVEIVSADQVAKVLNGDQGDTLKAMEKNVSRLTEDEIKAIAERVSRDAIDDWLETMPPSERASWKDRLTNLTYDIGVGLVTSGVWAGLVYALSKLHLLAGPELTEEQAKTQRRMNAVRSALASGLPVKNEYELENITDALRYEVGGERSLAERVRATSTFRELLKAIQDEDTRVGTVRGGFDFNEFSSNVLISELIAAMARCTQDKLVGPGA